MSDEKKFAQGIYVKDPHPNAPEFVLAKFGFKVDEVIDFLRDNENESGYVNCDMKKAQNGKMYLEVDTWKPSGERAASVPAGDESDEIPFG